MRSSLPCHLADKQYRKSQGLNSGAIKRMARRNERHAFNAQIRTDNFADSRDLYTFKPLDSNHPRGLQFLFPVFDAVPANDSSFREIVVIRKKDRFHRRSIEMLRIAA